MSALQAAAEALAAEMSDTVKERALAQINELVSGAFGAALTSDQRLLVEMGISAGQSHTMLYLQEKDML